MLTHNHIENIQSLMKAIAYRKNTALKYSNHENSYDRMNKS